MIGPDGLQLPSNVPTTQSPSFSFMQGLESWMWKLSFAGTHTECSQGGSGIASQEVFS
jgi:hypothetical protein